MNIITTLQNNSGLFVLFHRTSMYGVIPNETNTSYQPSNNKGSFVGEATTHLHSLRLLRSCPIYSKNMQC